MPTRYHDPKLCEGCLNCNRIMNDPGVPGCTCIVNCGRHGTLTWGDRGHSVYMSECKYRVLPKPAPMTRWQKLESTGGNASDTVRPRRTSMPKIPTRIIEDLKRQKCRQTRWGKLEYSDRDT